MVGLNFFVQLKGTESLEIQGNGTFVSHMLERKHTHYYVDQVRQPVFLVVVDVNNKAGYWVFVQEYLLDGLNGKKWRGKKSVAIRLPTKNRLEDTAKFRQGILSSQGYLAALHPAPVRDSIRKQQLRLESLDPRIEVRGQATASQECYLLVPREPIEFTMEFKGKKDEVDARMRRLFGHGLSVEFGPGEVELRGSPLLEETSRQGTLVLARHPLGGELTIRAVDAKEQEIARLEGLPAPAEGGSEQVRIRGGWGTAPLGFELTWNQGQVSGPVAIVFDLPRWHDQPLRLLPYFQRIRELVCGIASCHALRLEWYYQGYRCFAATVTQEKLVLFREIHEVLTVLDQARQVAEHYQVQLALPADFCPRHAAEVARLHGLVTAGEFREAMPDAHISAILKRVSRKNLGKILAVMTKDAVPLVICPVESQKMPFLGQQIDIGRIELHFNHTHLVSDRKRLQKFLSRKTLGQLKVEYTTASQCERVIRRAMS